MGSIIKILISLVNVLCDCQRQRNDGSVIADVFVDDAVAQRFRGIVLHLTHIFIFQGSRKAIFDCVIKRPSFTIHTGFSFNMVDRFYRILCSRLNWVVRNSIWA